METVFGLDGPSSFRPVVIVCCSLRNLADFQGNSIPCSSNLVLVSSTNSSGYVIVVPPVRTIKSRSHGGIRLKITVNILIILLNILDRSKSILIFHECGR